MTWDSVWAVAVSGVSAAWVFLSTGWDAAKVITAIAGIVTITSTGIGIYLKYRTTGRQLVKRILEFIHSQEQRLAGTRSTLNSMALLPSPARETAAPVFPVRDLEPTLKRLKWGNIKRAQGAIDTAANRAGDQAAVATKRAEQQKKEEALAHLMLGAIEASRQSGDSGELSQARTRALGEFNKALAIDAKDPDALQYAGLMLLQMGNAAGALERFNTLIELIKDGTDRLRIARAYRLQASAFEHHPIPTWGNANSALIKALENYPQDAPQLELAEAHEQHGDVRTKLGSSGSAGVANQSYQNALILYHAIRSGPAGAQGATRVTDKIALLNNVRSDGANGSAASLQMPMPNGAGWAGTDQTTVRR